MTDTASPIVTPEAVVLDFVTAGVGSRCVAKLIDVAIQATAIILVSVVVSIVFAFANGSEELGTVIMIITSFLVLIGYPVLLETLWGGKTVGKSVMGVRTVTREGAPIRFRHASIRGIIGLVEVYLVGFIAVITATLSRSNQRVGDFAGGTIVIRERTAVNHAVALTFMVPPGYETYAESLDVSALDVAQYQLIRSFLTRVLDLAPDARMAMAMRLANPVAVALDHDPPAGVGPELFLVCVVAAYQRRHGGGVPAAWGAPVWGPSQPGWGPPTGGGYGWGPAGQPPYTAPAHGQPAYAQPGYAPPPAYGQPAASGPQPVPYAPPPNGQPAPPPDAGTWAPPPPPDGWAPPPSSADVPAAAAWSPPPPTGFDPPG